MKQSQAAQRELAQREMARRHLLPFVIRFKPNYIAGWVHKVFAAKVERFYHAVKAGQQPRLMVFVPPRHGKNLAHETLVLTPTGWTKHGDLRPGDHVYHPSGEPVKVIAESPEADADIEIEFSNGQKIVAHANHEWVVHDRRTHGAQQRTIETQDMLAEHWIGEKGARGGRARWQLPDVKPLRFDRKDLPIDPYVLGVWLGDGTVGASNITNSAEDASVFQEAFAEAGYDCSCVYVHSSYGTHRSYFGRSGLISDLRAAGVLKDKHVPGTYLRGSKEQRLQLLAGLIDTDGHVEPHTGRCRFVTTSLALKDAVFDLASTLGFRPYTTSVPAVISSSGFKGNHEVFTVGFQPTRDLPTRIPRKRVEKEALRRKVSVVDVRKVEPRPGKCIQVDSSDGLYLAGRSLVPTHNSEIISNNFPSWALGQDPTTQVIMASHTVKLPLGFSRENRDRLEDKRYKVLFPETKLNPEASNAEDWKTTAKGGVKAAGVGGGISGFGADIFIIDDPIKDYEDSQSETIRETVKNWYTSTADNRLSPQSGVIIVQTRWSDDDLSGWRLRLMKELRDDGVPEDELEHWDVVSFPAIAETDEYLDKAYNIHHDFEPGRILVRGEGEALHEARYPLKVLRRKKHGMSSQQWSALFQQNPVPDSGAFFTKDDFVFYSSTPELHDYPVYFTWDLAVGEKRTNDWTVGLAAALIPHDGINTLYVLDMFRKRVRDKELYEAVVNMYLKYKRNASKIGLEYGQLFLAVERPILEEFKKHNISPVWDRELKPVQDKRVRATPARGWMQHHRIKFPKHAPWVETAMSELLRFDAGVNDDIVDALAWMVRMVKDAGLVRKYDPRKRNGSGFDNRTVDERVRDYLRSQPGSSTGFMSA